MFRFHRVDNLFFIVCIRYFPHYGTDKQQPEEGSIYFFGSWFKTKYNSLWQGRHGNRSLRWSVISRQEAESEQEIGPAYQTVYPTLLRTHFPCKAPLWKGYITQLFQSMLPTGVQEYHHLNRWRLPHFWTTDDIL